MEFKEIIRQAEEIQEAYDKLNDAKGEKRWGATEYVQGLVGDVGALTKLMMAKNNFRAAEDVDIKLKQELADCLWATIIIAKKLDIDLEKSYLESMEVLRGRIRDASEQ